MRRLLPGRCRLRRRLQQRRQTQLSAASAAHEQVHSIGMDLIDDRLMRGEIDLRDGDGEVLPLNRSLLLRIVDFQILDGEVGGLDVYVESFFREVREEVGVYGKFPARNISGESRLRKSLQPRQIELIDGQIGDRLRLRKIDGAFDRERAAAADLRAQVIWGRSLTDSMELLQSEVDVVE